MQSLSELALSLETGIVTVRGKDVPARAISAAASARLSKFFPRPMPPLVQDPSAGSAAPKIPDENDAAFKLKMEEWNTRRMTMEVILAITDIDDDVDGGFTLRMIKEATALESLCTRIEIVRMWNRVFAIGSDDDGAARRALVLDATVDVATVAAEPLPKEYCTTLQYAKLRIAERFGQPAAYADTLSPGWQKVLISYERLRQQEEAAGGV